MKPIARQALRLIRLTENTVAVIVLACLSIIPVLEIIARTFFKTGVYGSTDYVQHLVLWITFVGGMFASREKRHLALAAGVDSLPAAYQTFVKTLTSFISVAVVSGLAIASFNFIRLGLDASLSVGIFKTQYVAFIMPAGFAIMAVRFVNYAPSGTFAKLASCCGIVVPVLFATVLAPGIAMLAWPLALFLALSLAAGTPIFVVLGGLAQLFILKNTGETSTLANEAYTMLTGPTIPTIPLFSLAGYLLSESKAGERLVRLFRAVFGWMPGGLTVMAIMVSAFFTTFTGASGVTVIALGGLLSFILIQSGYKREFSVGFITSCGSLGLLFPPSLAVILYGVVSHVNIRHLFVAGVLPGLFIVTIMAVLGMLKSRSYGIKPVPFRMKEAALSLKESVWEVLLPIFILVGFFKGYFTLVEMSAITVLYVVIVEVIVKKDIRIRDLPKALLSCVPMVGGVLVILAVAKGLSYCIIDAEIPTTISRWAQANIHSKYVFLLLLNGALLVVGCFMDIFSAIIVIVPLIVPLGEAFGIAPVHLGIIFLTNLEIGYLMPPVGINLQLGSYRFNENMARMYRHIFPFVIALFAAVLAITYLPFLSTWLVGAILGRKICGLIYFIFRPVSNQAANRGGADACYKGVHVALLIVTILLTMSVTFMCSLLEACLMSLSLTDIAALSEKRPLIGSIWKNLRENIQKPIAVILIINTLATTVGSAFLGTQLSDLFGSHWVGIASVVFALVMIQWSEILPKTLGYRHNKLVATVFGIPLQAFVAAMTPALAVSQFLSSPFISKRRQTSADALGDINVLTRFAAFNKLISKEQARLVMKSIDLSKTRIAAVMMPRDQIKYLSSAMTLTDALIAAHHHYHTRYPLVDRDNLDAIIGYVNFKDIVIALHINPKDPTLKGVMRPMLLVRESEIASAVLNKMIQAHHHIAIAQDDAGRVTGLVTLEDIIEEVIGDIQDEFDILPRFVRTMPDQRFLVGGATPLSELREKVCHEFPDEPTQLDTWIRSKMKRQPKPKDRVPLLDFDIVITKIRRSQVHEAIVSCTGPQKPSPQNEP